jgi:hypothetical protein
MEELARAATEDLALEQLHLELRSGMGLEDLYQSCGWREIGRCPQPSGCQRGITTKCSWHWPCVPAPKHGWASAKGCSNGITLAVPQCSANARASTHGGGRRRTTRPAAEGPCWASSAASRTKSGIPTGAGGSVNV